MSKQKDKKGTQTIYLGKAAIDNLAEIRKLEPRGKSRSAIIQSALVEYRLRLARAR